MHEILNLLTGVSYFILSFFFFRLSGGAPKAYLPEKYILLGLLFAQFIGSCGLHHLCLSLHWMHWAHDFVMFYMASVSIAAAIAMACVWRDLRSDVSIWFLARSKEWIGHE